MAETKNIRIAIAEDNSYALKVIQEKLNNLPEITVNVVAGNGQDLLDKLPGAGRIDLVLMDIEMPLLDGIETTRRLKKQFPGVKVLMLTIFDDDDKILEAILAGADGYLLKEERARKIIQAIEETLDGGAGMSPGIARRVLKMMQNNAPEKPSGAIQPTDLTRREIEILEQLKAGMSYEKIGENLFISYGTVRKHIENVYRKMQVHNKVDAVQKAIRERLI
jgi:DNA-binding NarL/FixJ family response regulator